jgi:hypothetical protein
VGCSAADSPGNGGGTLKILAIKGWRSEPDYPSTVGAKLPVEWVSPF